MAKPSKPGEMRDVDIEMISLVGEPANRHKFQIFKSAGASEDANDEERGLVQFLKDFFTGKSGVEKGELMQAYNAKNRREQFNNAVDALRRTLGFDWESKDAVTDQKKISSALSDFNSIMADLLGSKSDITKAGKKISTERRRAIQAAYDALGGVLADTDEKNPEEDIDVNKEQLMELVKGAISEAVEPLKVKLEAIEKDDKTTEKAGTTNEEDSVAELIKSAIHEAIKPIDERIEAIEKTRGVSNKLSVDGDESDVEKSATNWGRLF